MIVGQLKELKSPFLFFMFFIVMLMYISKAPASFGEEYEKNQIEVSGHTVGGLSLLVLVCVSHRT